VAIRDGLFASRRFLFGAGAVGPILGWAYARPALVLLNGRERRAVTPGLWLPRPSLRRCPLPGIGDNLCSSWAFQHIQRAAVCPPAAGPLARALV